MRRLFDVIAVVVVIGFFLLGLYGAPRGEGSLYLWIALAVFAALAVGWLVAKSGEVVAGVGRDIRAARVAAAKIKLRGKLGSDAEPDVEAAFAALAKRDWKAAAALMFIVAEAGEPKAQHTLSHLFAAGAGVPRSREEALKWLRRAAERHLADAQYELGVAHFTGYGGTMPRSVADGLDWLRRAADQAHDGAAVRLGEVFQRGDGVEKDEHEAASWFRRAAERGDPFGQRALGRAYRKGRGLPKDAVQAYAWLAIAARRAAARGLHDFIRESELYDAEKDVGGPGKPEAQWLINAWDEQIDHVEVQQKKRKRDRERIRNLGRPIADRIRLEFDKIRDDAANAPPSPQPSLDPESALEPNSAAAPAPQRRRRAPKPRPPAEASATDRGQEAARDARATAAPDAPDGEAAAAQAGAPRTARDAAMERRRMKDEMRARKAVRPAEPAQKDPAPRRAAPDPKALADQLKRARASGRYASRDGGGRAAAQPQQDDPAPPQRQRGNIDERG